MIEFRNYHEVLVLLLRLRQVCSHPCLIQEEGQIAAFIAPDEVDDDWSPENREILSKARSELGAQWVTQMRQKLRTLALERIKAEKEVSQSVFPGISTLTYPLLQSPDATLDNEDCPICYDNITEGQLTKCGHCFCRDCIRKSKCSGLFNKPNNSPRRYFTGSTARSTKQRGT